MLFLCLALGGAAGFRWTGLHTDGTTGRQPQASASRWSEAYGKLPLSFEANRGQTDDQVKFLARGQGYTLFLTPTEAVLSLQESGARSQESGGEKRKAGPDGSPKSEIPNPKSVAVRMKLVGANPAPQVVGQEKLPGTVNYFTGNDPRQWRSNCSTYARVEYQEVYPGIDLVYYGNQQQLEYDLVVAPGANPDQIALAFDGAEHLEIDALGDLVFHLAGGGELRQHRPIIYQEIAGQRVEVEGAFTLFNPPSAIRHPPSIVAFEVGAYDAGQPLYIDPVLDYSGYFGGGDFDGGTGIAVGADGSAYVAGFTSSLNFPVQMAFQPTFGGGDVDAFVVKLNPTGSMVSYATYLGGNSEDSANDIAVDMDGRAYVTGDTRSTDFPTKLALQTMLGGDFDAYVTVLDPMGQLFFSTYHGGNMFDAGFGIAVGADRAIYVTGDTGSRNFPLRTPFQMRFGGGEIDAFVSKFIPPPVPSDLTEPEPAGDEFAQPGPFLAYSSFLGGNNFDSLGSIVVDAENNAYVTGRTNSSNYPTVNPFQRTLRGSFDAVFTKVAPAGNMLAYSTYFGGSLDDFGRGITLGVAPATDGSGTLLGEAQRPDGPYITGFTMSTNFPNVMAVQTRPGGGGDAFVVKFNAAGSALEFATYLGGNGEDFGFDIAVDAANNAHVVGVTESANFPTASALQMASKGVPDAFVTRLKPMGAGIDFSTFLGGVAVDRGFSIALDREGNAYVTGFTSSGDWPRERAVQTTLRGGSDAFISKIGK